MPRLAVLGHPVSHSRSPVMQSAALAELGLSDWSYEAIDVTADAFEALVRSLPDQGFAGVNVTVPHKLAALRLVDSASPAARAIGAANTLTFRHGGIEAENTDATGFLAALDRDPAGLRALVMGAGGSARAVVWALAEAGAHVSVWNRTAERAASLADDFGVSAVSAADAQAAEPELIVNCTTAGMPGGADLAELPLVPAGIRADQLVVDLAYGPGETPLTAAARARGAEVVDGLEVLVRQGAASLALWTGRESPLDAMRAAVRAP